MGFNCLRLIEPIQGDSLLFATKFPEISGTYSIDPGRMKDWVDLEVTQCFRTWDPWIGKPVPYQKKEGFSKQFGTKKKKNWCILLFTKEKNVWSIVFNI